MSSNLYAIPPELAKNVRTWAIGDLTPGGALTNISKTNTGGYRRAHFLNQKERAFVLAAVKADLAYITNEKISIPMLTHSLVEYAGFKENARVEQNRALFKTIKEKVKAKNKEAVEAPSCSLCGPLLSIIKGLRNLLGFRISSHNLVDQLADLRNKRFEQAHVEDF